MLKKKVGILILGVFAALFSLPLLAKDLPIKIKKEMSYAEARASLLKSGWQPVAAHTSANGTPVCYAVVGLSPSDDAYADLIDSEKCKYEEIESCAGGGMGFCSMRFFDGRNNYLSVVTEGGPPPDAFVNRWSLKGKRGHEETPAQASVGQANLEECKSVLLSGMHTGVLEDFCGFSGGVKDKLLSFYTESGCRAIVPQEFVEGAMGHVLRNAREKSVQLGETEFCREGAQYYNGFK